MKDIRFQVTMNIPEKVFSLILCTNSSLLHIKCLWAQFLKHFYLQAWIFLNTWRFFWFFYLKTFLQDSVLLTKYNRKAAEHLNCTHAGHSCFHIICGSNTLNYGPNEHRSTTHHSIHWTVWWNRSDEVIHMWNRDHFKQGGHRPTRMTADTTLTLVKHQ